VEGLGHAEELLIPRDDLPLCFNTQVSEKRDEGTQELGYAASIGRGVDMSYPGSLESRRQPAQLLDLLLAH